MKKSELYVCLKDLENRICEKQEDELYAIWKDYADGTVEDGVVFQAPNRKPSPPQVEWNNVLMNDALQDNTCMLLREFKVCSDILEHGGNALMQVRPNFGVGIMPMFFGAKPFIMERELDCLPNVYALEGYLDDIKKIIASPIPDFTNGRGVQIFDFVEQFNQIKKEFPKIGKYIFLEHPDTQGPMDICELLWGSALFVDFYEQEDLVHAFLRKITDTYLSFFEKWFSLVPQNGYHSWFGSLHKGTICVRNDSATNLSPDFYRQFILPYDSEVLTKLGGGMIHFCGIGNHFISVLSQTDGLQAVNVSIM